MHEITGNIWEFAGDAAIVVTTNGSVTRDGRAIFGNGVARQAAERYPGLDQKLGDMVTKHGSHVYDLGSGMISFPVEETAWSLPDLRIIARSARELRVLADRSGWKRVMVPRPGCGGGGLAWHEVRPVLLPWFDDRFSVITLTEQR